MRDAWLLRVAATLDNEDSRRVIGGTFHSVLIVALVCKSLTSSFDCVVLVLRRVCHHHWQAMKAGSDTAFML